MASVAVESFSLVSQAAVAFLIFAIFLIFRYPDRYVGTEARPELPGPKGLPLIGNVFDVLPWKGKRSLWYQYIFKKYGPLCTYTMPAWGRMIFINRPEWLAHLKSSMWV